MSVQRKVRAGHNQECPGTALGDRREGLVEFGHIARTGRNQANSEQSRGRLERLDQIRRRRTAGFNSTPTSAAPGTASCRNSSRFGFRSSVWVAAPVRLPPGRAKFGTSVPADEATMGIVRVASCAARAASMPPEVTSTSGPSRTSSAASVGSLSYSPPAQRYSIATFLPSL